jgi:transglutaminase-like putative cysteine protease
MTHAGWRHRFGGRVAAWRAGAAVAALGSALAIGGHVRAQTLADIPLEVTAVAPALAPASPPVPGGELRLRVHAADGAGLAKTLGLPASARVADAPVELRVRPGAHADLPPGGDALAASFVVDHDDADVLALRRQLLERRPAGAAAAAAVDAGEVVAFVAGAMRSGYGPEAGFASVVARGLSGDCTEHALLTTALARSFGIPARLVWGAVVVQVDGRWRAYGHAWVHAQAPARAGATESGRWTVLDSALSAHPGPVYYLPAIAVADEGPGHKIGLFQGFARMPRRIEILVDPDPAGALPGTAGPG